MIETQNNGNIIDIKLGVLNDGCYEYDSIPITIQWLSDKGFFGCVDFLYTKEDGLILSTETMGKEFAKKLINQLIDQAKLID